MVTLGKVCIYRPDDLPRVRQLVRELYQLPSPEVLATREWPDKMLLKDRIRLRMFKLLGRGLASPRPIPPIDGRNVRRVLLFRYDALGDYITTTSILEWLVAAIPGVEIDVVGSYRNTALLESDPRIRNVVAIHPSHGLRPSWKRVKELGDQEDYDVVIAAVFTRMTKAAVLTRFASRRALNVTIRHFDRAGIYGQVFHAQVPHIPAEHWADTMARVAPFSITPVVPVAPGTTQPKIPIEEAAVSRVVSWLEERDLRWEFRHETARVIPSAPLPISTPSGRPYIIVNISAYSPNRMWKPYACVPVIKELRRRLPDFDVLVSGSPTEADDVVATVLEVADPHVHEWRGSITELVAVISGAHQLISPDTATIHVAAAACVPCTVLFAELIKVAEWHPYGVNFRGVLSADPNTVSSIPASDIVNAVMEMI